MAKKKKFNGRAYDIQHKKNIVARGMQIQSLFDAAANKAGKIGATSGYAGAEAAGAFFFKHYPAAAKQVKVVLQDLHDGIVKVINAGTNAEWRLSQAKNNAMVNSLIGNTKVAETLNKADEARSNDALEAFRDRKEGGMSLSQRVWSFVNQTKEEFELAIEAGMKEGRSAADLSRDIRQALREPNKLFRRVRDKGTGQLRLSKAAKAYHPGRGVYRSSYKNALRMTATENNMAYRTSDHERWKKTPWVLGIEIATSTTNHEQDDMCDELAGRYPADFKFVGWHPFCRCFASPITASDEEFDKYTEALINGEDVSNYEFSGRVEDLPENFTNWCEENKERIENSTSTPYFLRDNFEGGNPENGPLWEKDPEPVEGAGGIKGIEARTDITSRKAEKEGRQIYDSYDSTAQTKSYIDTNSRALAEKLGIEGDIQPRDFYDADDGLPNEIGGDSNCVNCAFANELLRRGIDVRASSDFVDEIAQDNLESLWLTRNGNPVTSIDVAKKARGDLEAIKKQIEKQTSAPNGRFFISYNDESSMEQYLAGKISKEDVEGHVFSAERTPEGLVLYDHQNDCFVSIDAVLNVAYVKDGIDIFRVDDKIVNLANPYISRLLR